MQTYIILLRGINVGGKNKISMAELKTFLEKREYASVKTFINSGNVILQSKLSAKHITEDLEEQLPKVFKLDSELIKVLVLTDKELKKIASSRPKGFGDHPEKYYSDVIFLMGIQAEEAFKIFKPKEGVDQVWQGETVIYSQRLGERRTESRLSKIIGTPLYKSMTIRSWSTTTKLLKLIEEMS